MSHCQLCKRRQAANVHELAGDPQALCGAALLELGEIGIDAAKHRCLTTALTRAHADLADAYAEIRKQVAGSRVVFDRDICRAAGVKVDA